MCLTSHCQHDNFQSFQNQYHLPPLVLSNCPTNQLTMTHKDLLEEHFPICLLLPSCNDGVCKPRAFTYLPPSFDHHFEKPMTPIKSYTYHHRKNATLICVDRKIKMIPPAVVLVDFDCNLSVNHHRGDDSAPSEKKTTTFSIDFE